MLYEILAESATKMARPRNKKWGIKPIYKKRSDRKQLLKSPAFDFEERKKKQGEEKTTFYHESDCCRHHNRQASFTKKQQYRLQQQLQEQGNSKCFIRANNTLPLSSKHHEAS